MGQSNWYSGAVKMASFNFRRGLILLNMKKQMAISQKNAALSTSAKALGGHVDTKIYKDYNLHGGEKVRAPIKLDIGKREVVGFGITGNEDYIDDPHHPFPCHSIQRRYARNLENKGKREGRLEKNDHSRKKRVVSSILLRYSSRNTSGKSRRMEIYLGHDLLYIGTNVILRQFSRRT